LGAGPINKCCLHATHHIIFLLLFLPSSSYHSSASYSYYSSSTHPSHHLPLLPLTIPPIPLASSLSSSSLPPQVLFLSHLQASFRRKCLRDFLHNGVDLIVRRRGVARRRRRGPDVVGHVGHRRRQSHHILDADGGVVHPQLHHPRR